jgi:ribose transport system substrate-binding protein
VRRVFLRNVLCAIGPILFLSISGCGQKIQEATPTQSESAAKPSGATKKYEIALIMKSLANEFFITMEKGARDHQATHAGEYELIANGIKDELDVGAQVQLVENIIARGVDAIVITPTESKALAPVCKKAIDAGIMVVNIDNKFDVDVLKEVGATIPFVGPDNRKGAKAVGDYLATKLKPGDPVAIIEGVPTAFNAQQRKQGFVDAMEQAGMKIVTSQSGSWEMDPANKVVSGIITEHPELKAIVCANDSMALGAVAALQAAGKTDVIVTGFDNISAVQELMKEGKILATADQHSDQLAVFGIEYALEMLKTKSTPQDRETPVTLIPSPLDNKPAQ